MPEPTRPVMLTYGDPMTGFLLIGSAGPLAPGQRPPAPPTPRPLTADTAGEMAAQLPADVREVLAAAFAAVSSAERRREIADAVRAHVRAHAPDPAAVNTVVFGRWAPTWVVDDVGIAGYVDGTTKALAPVDGNTWDLIVGEISYAAEDAEGFALIVDVPVGTVKVDYFAYTA